MLQVYQIAVMDAFPHMQTKTLKKKDSWFFWK